VFHFIQTGHGAASRGGDLIDLRFGMVASAQEQGGGAPNGLIGYPCRRLGIEADLDTPLPWRV
jgi:hypothetical protein